MTINHTGINIMPELFQPDSALDSSVSTADWKMLLEIAMKVEQRLQAERSVTDSDLSFEQQALSVSTESIQEKEQAEFNDNNTATLPAAATNHLTHTAALQSDNSSLNSNMTYSTAWALAQSVITQVNREQSNESYRLHLSKTAKGIRLALRAFSPESSVGLELLKILRHELNARGIAVHGIKVNGQNY